MMSHIGWSRAAYVFFVLAVLAALLKLGTFGLSDASPLRQASAKSEARTESSKTQDEQSVESSDAEAVAGEAAATSATGAAASVVNVSRKGDPSILPRETEDGTAIFYRPVREKAGNPGTVAPRQDAPGQDAPALGMSSSAASGPVCGNLRDAPKSSRAVFPLSEDYFNSYDDTWGAARPQGGHEGTDLMAPMKTPEYAMTDGTIVPVSGANANGWNTLGGYTVMLRADYSVGPIQQGDLFYYAHMDREAPLPVGTRVRAGQLIGYAGDTGQGSEVTRGLFPSHLHLGWYDTSGGRTNLASGAMNPYPLLEWVKSNGGAVSGGTDAKFCTAPQTGTPTPSTGEQDWMFPTTPGTRPDIDTGTEDAAPSPIVKNDRSSVERAPKQAPSGTSKPKEKPGKSTIKKKQPNHKSGAKIASMDKIPTASKPVPKPERPKAPKVREMIDWVKGLVNRDGDRNRNEDQKTRAEKRDRDRDAERGSKNEAKPKEAKPKRAKPKEAKRPEKTPPKTATPDGETSKNEPEPAPEQTEVTATEEEPPEEETTLPNPADENTTGEETDQPNPDTETTGTAAPEDQVPAEEVLPEATDQAPTAEIPAE